MHFWQNKTMIWGAYTLLAMVAALQRLFAQISAEGFTTYENYRIFKYAFSYLTDGQNPYSGHPGIWDLYKYSPAFALFMAPFYYVPDALGLPLWNLLNALVLLAAIFHLPLITDKQKAFMAWFVLPEMLISIQNSQSNALTAGLFLWTFIGLEKGQRALPAAWVALNGFIKIFGVMAALPALFYARKWRFSVFFVLSCLILTFVPLMVISPQQLWQVYQWWGELLAADHSASLGLSVQGWLSSWFGWLPDKSHIVVGGLVILLASYGAVWQKEGLPSPYSRLLVWASLLIWVVIFNHKAESPTFVIAMCGVALWYFAMQQNNPSKQQQYVYITLLVIAFVLASLSPSDIFSRSWRDDIVKPYVLKAVPFVLIWLLLTIQLLQVRFRKMHHEGKLP
jgi:Glycosyltransferase family 87